MSLKSLFSNVWTWIKHAFQWLKKDADKVAIAIVQDLNVALNSGLVDLVVKAISPNTDSLPTEVLATLKKVIPNTLAILLSLQALPDNPTEDDLKAFAEKVLEAFKNESWYGQSKIYTTVAADALTAIREALADGKISFAEAVKIVETALQGWKLAQAQNPDTSYLNGLTENHAEIENA